MTVATLTNVPSIQEQKLPQGAWLVDAIEQKRAAAEQKINSTVAQAQATAVATAAEAKEYAGRQAERATLRLALLAPFALIALFCLVGTHVDLGIISHFLPGCAYLAVGYVFFSALNSRRFRSEP